MSNFPKLIQMKQNTFVAWKSLIKNTWHLMITGHLWTLGQCNNRGNVSTIETCTDVQIAVIHVFGPQMFNSAINSYSQSVLEMSTSCFHVNSNTIQL